MKNLKLHAKSLITGLAIAVLISAGGVFADRTSSLPDQTGHAGQFLQTDGTNPLWASTSGGGGITSINGDSTAAQTITGGADITVTDLGAGFHQIAFTGVPTGELIGSTSGNTTNPLAGASTETWLGDNIINAATNNVGTVFLGNGAGGSASRAQNSIFIGNNAGNADTVNNTGSEWSILIGNDSGTNGNSNSIAIGQNAINKTSNQLVVGSGTVSADAIGEVSLGDWGNLNNGTSLILSDRQRSITSAIGNQFDITDTSGNTIFNAVTAANKFIVNMGDVDQAFNSTLFQVDDDKQIITAQTNNDFEVTDTNGNAVLNSQTLPSGDELFQAGDIGGINNNTLFTVSDNSQEINSEAFTGAGQFNISSDTGVSSPLTGDNGADLYYLDKTSTIQSSVIAGDLSSVLADAGSANSAFMGSFLDANNRGEQAVYQSATAGNGFTYFANVINHALAVPSNGAIAMNGLQARLSMTNLNTGVDRRFMVTTSGIGYSGSSTFILPDVDGTSGEVMTTDGAGNLSFQSKNLPHTIFTPVTSSAVSVVDNNYNIIAPTGAISLLTVDFSSISPVNNDVVEIKYTQAVTGITYMGATFAYTPNANAVAGDFIKFTYDAGTNTWY